MKRRKKGRKGLKIELKNKREGKGIWEEGGKELNV
jgi:hypothetical protein